MNQAPFRSIYLLEQDPTTTEIIRNLCQEKSLVLSCFSSGCELLSTLESNQPSCIIVANDQPHGQAFTLMQAMSSANHQLPVIILGHHNDVSGAVAAIKAGALDYIEKPTIYGRLAEQLNQVIKQSLQRA